MFSSLSNPGDDDDISPPSGGNASSSSSAASAAPAQAPRPALTRPPLPVFRPVIGTEVKSIDFTQTDPDYDPSHYLRIVHVSDTHGTHNYEGVPDGDVFIFSGDMTNYRNWHQVGPSGQSMLQIPPGLRQFNDDFLAHLKHPLKIVIGGNHDYLDRVPGQDFDEPSIVRDYLPDCTYLRDSGFELDVASLFPSKVCRDEMRVIKIWGSPWTHFANMGYGTGDLPSKWDLIPDDTSILVTHTPPFGIMDLAWCRQTAHCNFCNTTHRSSSHWGCPHLRAKVEKLRAENCLKLHLFGHVHEFKGIIVDDQTGMVYMNGSGRVTRWTKVLTYDLKIA